MPNALAVPTPRIAPVSPVQVPYFVARAAVGFALCALGVLPIAPAQAATAPPAAARVSESDAIWRAASRLGYWPSPELTRVMRDHPRGAEGWALDEIDRAFEASRQPARLPTQLASLGQPLPTVFSEFQKEREARRQGEARKAADVNPPRIEGTAPMRAAALPFSRTSAQEAAAWRMGSCSDASVENPLLARMTEFWFNHLNVFVGKGSVRPFVGHYVLNAIRPNVLGRFETLLVASARHPAMLFYLDQAQNVAEGTMGARDIARGLNENYARELMELHTLGVDGGYSQRDVRELARVLTGWTVDPGADSGFRYVERLHDQGEKTVLGRRFSGEGEAEGQRALAMLAEQPATARRIARRLAQFFVADEPSAALIDRLADEYRAGRGDMRRVMRTLVRSPEFWDPANELFKTPFDFACSALAASTQANATNNGPRPRMVLTLGFLAGAGQAMHDWQTPDGYRTDAATWISPESLTRRADLAAALTVGADDPVHLVSFFGGNTRERIARLPVASRAALAVASPDFMRK
ncbi:MAG: DUF1800 domain-containing protein [Proteobacteria bacterium]|nr:DUF1800 domain-containing protein [Burkholderiales bacterium]